MKSEDTPTEGLPTTSFRMEEGFLVCSGSGMAERRIFMADVAGWVRKVQNDKLVFQLMMNAGGAIDLQDPHGELERALSILSNDFVSLDDILKSSGQVHEDECLGRFIRTDGLWRLNATVDLPFQADVRVTFELELDTPQLPESMPKNVIWIQDNLGGIWNAAAAAVNAMIETERIPMPETFSISDLWVFLPDAPVEHADWRLVIEPRGTSIWFEVVFTGFSVTRHTYDAA